MISASKLEEAFPEISSGLVPLGTRVIVQLRTVRAKTNAGLILVEDTKDFNKSLSQLGKVVSVGPIAYCNRNTGEKWPEGTWVQNGDLVRVPKYAGDRFERSIPGTDDTAMFVILNDHEVIAKISSEVFEDIDQIK